MKENIHDTVCVVNMSQVTDFGGHQVHNNMLLPEHVSSTGQYN